MTRSVDQSSRDTGPAQLALFTFPSLSAYEDYRTRMVSDPECVAAFEMDKRNRSIISYERSFLRPVFS